MYARPPCGAKPMYDTGGTKWSAIPARHAPEPDVRTGVRRMFRARLTPETISWPAGNAAITLGLTGANLLFNIVAAVAFRFSADSHNWRAFLAWQVVGNLAGFVTVLVLTALLHYVPLHVAYPVTTGLAVIGVQVVAAAFLFREAIAVADWLGALLIVIGVVVLGAR